MPAESLSHHQVGSQNASVYNNRLRLAGVKTTFFHGFDLLHYNWGFQV